MMTRRQAIKTTALATAVAATAPAVFAQTKAVTASASATAQVMRGPFTLPPLPYAVDALEPHLDARTMEIHHDRHHKAYVDNLNKAVAEFPKLGYKSLEELVDDPGSIPANVVTAIRNNGGGHLNHSLFWQMMKKDGGGEPKGDLAKAIEASFGSFSGFRERFSEAATKLFGSGWVWLVVHEKHLVEKANPLALTIKVFANQDTPTVSVIAVDVTNPGQRSTPSKVIVPSLLGLDVWEHAYYLKYQNKRADYLKAFWNVVNWAEVAKAYAAAK